MLEEAKKQQIINQKEIKELRLFIDKLEAEKKEKQVKDIMSEKTEKGALAKIKKYVTDSMSTERLLRMWLIYSIGARYIEPYGINKLYLKLASNLLA